LGGGAVVLGGAVVFSSSAMPVPKILAIDACAASSISKKAPRLSPAGRGVREGWGAESRTGLDYAPRWRQLRDIASRRRGARLALIAGAAQKERVTTIVSE
jgi:hypothetical protein